ncbi:phosphoglycerate dehydrogenase [Feifania hominis]|uniref:Phosphoglycerate dehydrogenase n=1 Tax=Feifania hominis TaxID=2763660 RepID=A0A926DCC1_9FIRM|nr:phosphoglycerate dehydrogenase [Feifania hominis]MBC8536365.1 phosphoglycerate dehydrogenase [Feifania hominis]
MDHTPKIYIETTRNYDRVYPGFVNQFRERGYDVRTVYGNDLDVIGQEEVNRLFAGCDVCVVCLGKLTAEMMDLAPNLKMIATFGAGYDHIDVKAATARGIPVVNGRGGGAIAVAELVLGMMLSLSRHIPEMHDEMRKNLWRSRLGTELHGKTLGIMGVGAIGGELARIAKSGFGMRILAHDLVENPELVEQFGVSYVDSDTLFSESDYISIHTPLLPSTRGIVGREKLALMKPTAYLINASRGGVVDERALYNALKNGQIAGAGLDVFEQEPYMDNIFAEFESVITTTHIGANTPETVFRIAKLLTEDIEDVINGLPPRQNIVNPDVMAALAK